MGLIQESRAEKALEALTKLAAPTAKVRRDGRVREIPSSEVVPGDIVLLEAGNFVPADSRILQATRLAIEESALTGEAVSVMKDDSCCVANGAMPADMVNMAFATTTVTSGHGEAVVCDIGMKTKVGQIAKLILSDEAPETPLQRKLRRSRKETGTSSSWNLFFNIYNRYIKENSLDANVYDICWACCCGNTRRLTCYCYNSSFNWSNKDG